MLKKTVLGLVTAAVLATTASADNYTKKLFKQGLTATTVSAYNDKYIAGENDYYKLTSFMAFEHFKHMYITLVNSKDTLKYKKDREKDKTAIWKKLGNAIAMTIFDDDVIKSGDSLTPVFKMKMFAEMPLTGLEMDGLPTNMTYTVQKIVNHTAVTITLNIPQIARKYGEFLKILRKNAKNKEQFNEYFQNLAVLMYFVYPKYFPMQNEIGLVPAKTVYFIQKMAEQNILSSEDFVKLILGVGYAAKTELTHNKELAKFVNYIVTDQYEKAAKMIIQPSAQLRATKNFLFRVLEAAAAQESNISDIKLSDKGVNLLAKESNVILKDIPEELTIRNMSVTRKAYMYISNKVEQITRKIRNIPDLRKPVKE